MNETARQMVRRLIDTEWLDEASKQRFREAWGVTDADLATACPAQAQASPATGDIIGQLAGRYDRRATADHGVSGPAAFREAAHMARVTALAAAEHDATALDHIAALLGTAERDPATCDAIAALVRATGRQARHNEEAHWQAQLDDATASYTDSHREDDQR